ncbi:MAG: tetratricopeptide repeat protein, partial [Cyanobacteria bacterium J06636_16]
MLVLQNRWLRLIGAVCLGAGVLVSTEGLWHPSITNPAEASPNQAALSLTPLQTLLAQTPPASPAQATLDRGLELIQQGAVTEAIAAFEEAIQLDPSMAAAHYNLGLDLRQTGELQAAADSFWKALEADPQFAMAYSNLGAALWEGGNLEQATDYLERAIELQPDLGNAYYNLGLVKLDAQDYEAALV